MHAKQTLTPKENEKEQNLRNFGEKNQAKKTRVQKTMRAHVLNFENIRRAHN